MNTSSFCRFIFDSAWSCTCQQDIGFLEKRRCSTYIHPEVSENKESGPSRGCCRKSKVRADRKTHAVHQNQTARQQAKVIHGFYLFHLTHFSYLLHFSSIRRNHTKLRFPSLLWPRLSYGCEQSEKQKGHCSGFKRAPCVSSGEDSARLCAWIPPDAAPL